jgi:putative transposase
VNHHLSTAAIDLGEIHAISSVSENHEGILITGRKLRSIKRLRNRKLAELQRKMKKWKKGSRQWKKYNKAKRYILSKTNIQLRDALHKISRKFVHWCAEQRIRHVVIGDVEGVQRHTRKKRGKTVNQKLAQWQFGQLLKYLEYTNSRRKESRLKKSMKPIPRKHVLFAPEERNLLVECTSASVVMSNIVIFMAPAIS